MELLPSGVTIENVRFDEFRHAIFRALTTPREGTSPKDTRVTVDYFMEAEFNFIEGCMFLAFLTAYCCGIGFPNAGICLGPRDFDPAISACTVGVIGDQGYSHAQINLIIERGIKLVTGHEWYALFPADCRLDPITGRPDSYMIG